MGSHGWVLYYKNIWNEVVSQVFQKLTTKSIKGDGQYKHCKLKMWKERIKTNFYGQDVPYDMYCNVAAVLKDWLRCKQNKNYDPQVHV